MELTQVLMIIIASIWTILIFMYQFVYVTKKPFGVPYEKTGKVLIVTAHAILVAAIWISTLQLSQTTNWVLIVIAFVLITIWFFISQVQDRYMFEKISAKYKEIFDKITEEHKQLARKNGY